MAGGSTPAGCTAAATAAGGGEDGPQHGALRIGCSGNCPVALVDGCAPGLRVPKHGRRQACNGAALQCMPRFSVQAALLLVPT